MLMAGGLGLEHNLLRFAGAPGLAHSRLAGFGGSLLTGRPPSRAYWSLFGLILVLVAAALWRRGQRPDWRAVRRPLALASAAFLAAGGAIFHQTNGLHRYQTAESRLDWREAYERKYRRLEEKPQPRAPPPRCPRRDLSEERRARIAGRYRFENVGQESLREVVFNLPAPGVVLSPELTPGGEGREGPKSFRSSR